MADTVLQITDWSGKTYMVPLQRFPFTIGRSVENDLPLCNPSISKKHATIEKRGSQLLVIDEESRNHVFVNGHQVTHQSIAPGDVLQLGAVEILVRRCPALHVHGAERKLDAVYSAGLTAPGDGDAMKTVRLPAGEAVPTAERAERPEWHRSLLGGGPAHMADLHERAMDAIAECVEFDRCLLLLFEHGTPEDLVLVAMRLGPRYDARRAPEAEGEILISREILRRVAETREIVRVTEKDHAIQLRESFIMSGARTALCFQLVVRGQVSGVLYLDRLRRGTDFTDEDIAGIIALRVENLRLLEELGAS